MNMQEYIAGKLTYLVRYPDAYREGNTYPVLLFLHGAGTRGNRTDALRAHPFFADTQKHPDFPFVSVAPLCSENTWFDLFESLEALVEQIVKAPFADPRRIYLMGASMGGYGTWQLAMSMPEVFAAIVPICGGGMYWNAARLVNVPIWAFHGAMDTVVCPEESRKMVDAVNRAGGEAKLTLYPENAHNAWSDTFADPEVFSWLLSHKNKNATALVDRYRSGEIYG